VSGDSNLEDHELTGPEDHVRDWKNDTCFFLVWCSAFKG